MMRIGSVGLFRLAVWCAVGCSAAPSALADNPPAAAPARPNIIFILADDLGYGDLGCYGQKQIKTPNLDRLAADGLQFTQCYAGSTVCAPSRCALMTGLNMGRARIRGNKDVPLRDEDVTVAEVLKDAGYATALIGKWGLGDPRTTGVPTRQGFDYFFGYMNQHHAHDYHPDHLWRNEEKVELAGNADGKKGEYSHDLFTREALDYLRGRKAAGGQPFFLYLAYTIPHANNELGAKAGNGMEIPSDAPYTNMDWPQPEKNFAAMVTRLDADVGRIMSELKLLGLEESTIIFFTSDNGPHHEGGHDDKFFASSGALRGSKRDLYEGGIRVPMLVRWPGKIAPGGVTDYVWAFWDFLPTAAQLADAPTPEGIDGRSIVPALLHPPGADGNPFSFQGSADAYYWEFHERGFTQGVRMGDWKAVRKGAKGPMELYNLKTDPGEARDAAAEHPDVLAKIEEYLATARTESEDWPVMRED